MRSSQFLVPVVMIGWGGNGDQLASYEMMAHNSSLPMMTQPSCTSASSVGRSPNAWWGGILRSERRCFRPFQQTLPAGSRPIEYSRTNRLAVALGLETFQLRHAQAGQHLGREGL